MENIEDLNNTDTQVKIVRSFKIISNLILNQEILHKIEESLVINVLLQLFKNNKEMLIIQNYFIKFLSNISMNKDSMILFENLDFLLEEILLKTLEIKNNANINKMELIIVKLVKREIVKNTINKVMEDTFEV